MKYDFTTIMDRRGKDAMAVDRIPYKDVEIKEGFSRLPMWVADMNFATAPSITAAIGERIKHPAFGYFDPSDAYFDAIISWQARHNGAKGLSKECIGYENGVLGGVISALNVLCEKGGSVLLHSPTYIGFTFALTNSGFNIVHSPLKKDGGGVWRMDYEDMDRKIKENKIHAAIFCNPHNPCGRVWEKAEIEKAMEVYKANNVFVISDEIWSDLILDGYRHTPVQSISEDARQRTVALYAPSKTFNLAGLVGSYHIIYNSYLRDRIIKESSLPHYNEMNVLSMHALIGAYSEVGEEWLNELRQVLTENVDYAFGYISKHFAGVELSKPQGTYMLFLDCSAWCAAHGKTIDDVLRAGYEVGVIWQDGRQFNGANCIRMNLALPLSEVKEAMERIDRYVFNCL
jgi:Bifunctional PLP-dependent enzyme with beta-cystathionase and maltose regulon repressor activities